MNKLLIRETVWNVLFLAIAGLLTGLITGFEFKDLQLHDFYMSINPWHLGLFCWVFLAMGRYLLKGGNQLSRKNPAVTLWISFFLLLLLVYALIYMVSIIRFEKSLLVFYEDQIALKQQFYVKKWIGIGGLFLLFVMEFFLIRRLYRQLFKENCIK